MADKLRIGNEWRELKLGASFTNNKSTSFHTLKCDFKPASVDASKMATVDVGTNNQVTVTVPHLDGAGIPQTVFKGNQRPYQKECVLIIDKVTGEITLEKLSSNIQVKKTRQEPPQKPAPPPVLGPPRPPSPETLSVNNCTQRSTSRTKVASGGRRGASAKPSGSSPHRHRTSPPQATPWTVNSGQSTLASLPMIGFDDSAQPPAMMPAVQPERQSFPPLNNVRETTPLDILRNGEEEDVGVLSSSSGSSSSGSESDHSNSGQSDDQRENHHQRHLPPPSLNSLTLPNTNRRSNPEPPINGAVNGNGNSAGNSEASMPMHLLNEDLCLSESGSDSD